MSKLIKGLFILFVLIFFCTGCSESINLMSGKVANKVTYNDTKSRYEIISNEDQGFLEQYIFASPDFAKVGYIIVSKDGVIKAMPPPKKE